MSEELFRRGRVAAALVAGPAVTVGLMGIGAPAFAQEGTGPENPSTVDESVEGADSSSADSDSGGQGGEAPHDEGADSGEGAEDVPSVDDAANEGDGDTDAEELEDEGDVDEPQDDYEDEAGPATVTIENSEVEPGGTLVVTGEHYNPGENVEFRIGGVFQSSTTADDDGRISAEVVVPVDAEPGGGVLEAVREGGSAASGGFAIVAAEEDEGGEDENGEEDGSDEDEGSGDEDEGADEGNGNGDGGNGSGDVDERSDHLTLDAAEVYPGDEITVVGEDFNAEENVTFSLNPELGTVPADANGVVTAVLTIPEDVQPGTHELTADGETSGHSATATLTVLDPEDGEDGPEEEVDAPDIDPDLSIDAEKITLEDFIGDPEEGAGVNHIVEGLAPGQPIEWLVTGPEGVNENIGAAVASEEGLVDFRIHGFETPEPAIYLGEYTTLVAVQGEGGEIIELEAAFTVVDGTEDEDQNGTPGDDETAPPEDDGSGTPPSDGHDEQVPPEGDGDAETPSKGEGHDEQVPAHDEAESGTPSKGEYQQAPSHDDGGSLTKDDGAHHDADHYADHRDGEAAADSTADEGSPSAHDGDELANTGSNLTAGILSGLLVALGAGLAFFGYRHRIGRHSA